MRRGGREIKTTPRSLLIGAAGVVAYAETKVAGKTTTPAAPLRLLRVFFLTAQPPLLTKEGNYAAPKTFAKKDKKEHSRYCVSVSLCLCVFQ